MQNTQRSYLKSSRNCSKQTKHSNSFGKKIQQPHSVKWASTLMREWKWECLPTKMAQNAIGAIHLKGIFVTARKESRTKVRLSHPWYGFPPIFRAAYRRGCKQTTSCFAAIFSVNATVKAWLGRTVYCLWTIAGPRNTKFQSRADWF